MISKETTFAAGFCAPVSSGDSDPHASLAVSLPTQDSTDASLSAAAAPARELVGSRCKAKRKRLEDSTASASAADLSIGEVCFTVELHIFLTSTNLLYSEIASSIIRVDDESWSLPH